MTLKTEKKPELVSKKNISILNIKKNRIQF